MKFSSQMSTSKVKETSTFYYIVVTSAMFTVPNFWKYSFISSDVVFQGSPKTIRSPEFSSVADIFVILDSGSFTALGDSSIFRLVVLSNIAK